MKQTFRTTTIGLLLFSCIGCQQGKVESVDFLSNYDKLVKVSDTRYHYPATKEALKQYDKFIIEPIILHWSRSSTLPQDSEAKRISAREVVDMKNYLHDAIKNAIKDRYDVVYQAGPGVARVKIALTDLKPSRLITSKDPASRLLGPGVGGAALEAELLDSQTDQQIGAIVELQKGNVLSANGFDRWGDAKSVMDDWAQGFRKALDEAHD